VTGTGTKPESKSPPAPGVKAKSSSFGAWLWEWTKSIAVALVVWFLLRTFLVEAFRIPSGSMERTLLIGDFLFVNKALYGAEVPIIHTRLPAFREPERGDIIVFDSVEDEGLKVVKRLIGLPGDTLAMRQGRLIRNGDTIPEPYTTPVDPTHSEDPMQRARMRRWQLPHYIGPAPEQYQPDLHDWGRSWCRPTRSS
jgi:signal peptidase I